MTITVPRGERDVVPFTTWATLPAEVVALAWTDPDYRRRLLADPPTTLRESGFEPPGGLVVVADTRARRHLPLPQPGRHRAAASGRAFDWQLPDDVVERATADHAFRQRLLADAPAAAAELGHDPPANLVVVADDDGATHAALPLNPFESVARSAEQYCVELIAAVRRPAPPRPPRADVHSLPPVPLVREAAPHPGAGEPPGAPGATTAGLRARIAGDLARFDALLAAWCDALPSGVRRLPDAAVEAWRGSADRRARRRFAWADRIDALLPSLGPAVARVTGSRAAVVDATPLGGDPHRDGQEVLGLLLADGNRCVLRPTRLWAFPAVRAACLLVADRASIDVRVPVTATVAGGLELVEWVPHDPDPRSAGELAGYHRRFGALAAIAWLLGVTDLNQENVVSDGAGPVAIDAEFIAQDVAPDGPLFFTGLVDPPGRVGSSPLSSGSAGPAVAEGAGVRVVGDGGRHRLVWGIPTVEARHWVAGPDGRRARAADDVGALVDGFLAVARALAPTRRPAGRSSTTDLLDLVDGSRHQVRPTVVYAALLAELDVPSVRSRAGRAGALHGRLLGLPGGPGAGRPEVAACEIGDLSTGDVPYFVARCWSAVVTHDSGLSVRVAGAAPIDQVASRLAALGARADTLAEELAVAARRAATPPVSSTTDAAVRTVAYGPDGAVGGKPAASLGGIPVSEELR